MGRRGHACCVDTFQGFHVLQYCPQLFGELVDKLRIHLESGQVRHINDLFFAYLHSFSLTLYNHRFYFFFFQPLEHKAGFGPVFEIPHPNPEPDAFARNFTDGAISRVSFFF